MAMTRAAAVLLGLLAAAGPAWAAPPSPAAQAVAIGREGDALFKQGRFREALARYDEAWRLAPAPVLLWNRARCHEELAELEQALALFEDVSLSDAPLQKRRAAARRAARLRVRIDEAKAAAEAEAAKAAEAAQQATPVPDAATAAATPTEQPTTVVETGTAEEPPAPPGFVLRTNGLMLIPVSPVVEGEVRLAEHWSLELGLAFGMPVGGRGFGLGGLLGARWYPLQPAPSGWFVEAAVLGGGEPSGAAEDTAGVLVGVATGYQYLAWDTLALGIAAGPGLLATADEVIFFPALRADVGVAF